MITKRKAFLLLGLLLTATTATISSVAGPAAVFTATILVAVTILYAHSKLDPDPVTVETAKRNLIIAAVRNKALLERNHQKA